MTDESNALFQLWSDHIPLVSAMEITVQQSKDSWHLEAPLQPNVNHMGTGFGGSISVIATLAGWAQTYKILPRPAEYDIVIARSNVNFRKPALGPLVCTADVPSDKAIDTFLNRVEKKGRSAIRLTTRVYSNDVEAATFVGKFAATLKAKT